MKFTISNYQLPKLLIAIALFLFSTVTNAQAATLIPCGTTGNPCQFCHIFVLIDNIIDYVLTTVVPTIATGLIVWGGFKLVTGTDKTKAYREAKDIITATVVGLGIILISWMLLGAFLTAMGVAQWTGLGSWWQINCP
jgi:hypothetical protein